MTTNSFITIKEPCQQSWQNMSSTEQGRFCSSCKKQVYDLTNASADEIKKAYEENSNSLCGRVSGKLLNQQYVESQTQRVYFSHSKIFCFAVLLCFGTSLFTIQSAKANTLTQLKNKFFQINQAADSVTIKGVATDKNSKEKLPFVTISLMQGDSVIVSTMTDVNGEYKLKADPKKYKMLDLKANYIGYENVLIKNVAMTNDSVLNVDMEFVAVMLGGIGSETIYPAPSGIMRISDSPVIYELPNGTTIIQIGDDDL